MIHPPAHWPDALRGLWSASTEAARSERLCRADPADYGGEARLRAAIWTCLTDFEQRMAAESLRDRRATEADAEARRRPAESPPAVAPPGYTYRACRRCVGGVRRPGGQPCTCAVALGARPGFELCASTAAAPLHPLPEGRA